jgi:heavy metal sensor kinase
MIGEDKRKYFLAIGRSITEQRHTLAQFTRNYFASLPVFLALSGILGWFIAARSLEPVNRMADAAHRISSSNLELRLPSRDSNDELDRLTEAFNRMMDRLKASFEQIRQFSTDVSHELRTPLTAIRGQLEVALFTAKTEEQYRDAMVNALQDVERLSAIVKSLLLLSQAESGQLALQKEEIDAAASVRDIVEQFQIPASEAELRLTVHTPQHCIGVVDRVQFERLVANLLSNAVKYTPPGGTVEVRLDCRGDVLSLEVEDSGRGIPAADLPHIFDRFYRVRTGGRNPEQGLGLGLSFVAWIVKAHGGTIQVHSEPGKGSRFVVTLQCGVPSARPLPFSEVHVE